MFTDGDFENLRFLEGRWIGKAPDGTSIYGECSFTGEGEMRSDRHVAASFSHSTDASVVALPSGRVTSTWKDVTWTASGLVPGQASFEPVNAAGSFCRERISDDEVHVTQRWTDESGTAHAYVVSLPRS